MPMYVRTLTRPGFALDPWWQKGYAFEGAPSSYGIEEKGTARAHASNSVQLVAASVETPSLDAALYIAHHALRPDASDAERELARTAIASVLPELQQ